MFVEADHYGEFVDWSSGDWSGVFVVFRIPGHRSYCDLHDGRSRKPILFILVEFLCANNESHPCRLEKIVVVVEIDEKQ